MKIVFILFVLYGANGEGTGGVYNSMEDCQFESIYQERRKLNIVEGFECRAFQQLPPQPTNTQRGK